MLSFLMTYSLKIIYFLGVLTKKNRFLEQLQLDNLSIKFIEKPRVFNEF